MAAVVVVVVVVVVGLRKKERLGMLSALDDS